MKKLEKYFRECNYNRTIDHSLRATVIEDKVKFYIHPVNANGDTLDFEVIGDALIPLTNIGQRVMSFSAALEALKAGKRVARKGWNGKGMFIYLVKETLVDKEFLRNEASLMPICDNTGVAHFNAHIDMKTADNKVTVGWNPSQVDMFAEDWEILS